MSDQATTAVLASFRGSGPWGDDGGWVVATVLQLAEGGSGGPVWVTEAGPRSDSKTGALIVDSLEPEVVSEALAVAVFAQLAPDEELATLESEGVIRQGRFATEWRPRPSTLEHVRKWLSDRVRLAIVPLDDLSSLNENGIEYLRSAGIEVVEFVRR